MCRPTSLWKYLSRDSWLLTSGVASFRGNLCLPPPLVTVQELASDSCSLSTSDAHAVPPTDISPSLFDDLRDAVVECCRVRHWTGFCSHPLFYKYIQVGGHVERLKTA